VLICTGKASHPTGRMLRNLPRCVNENPSGVSRLFGEGGCARAKFGHLGIRKRSSERELNPMERWNDGILEYWVSKRKSIILVQGAHRLRIASLRHKAKNSWPSTSSPPRADGPLTSITVICTLEPHHSSIPLFQYSSWSEARFGMVKNMFEQR